MFDFLKLKDTVSKINQKAEELRAELRANLEEQVRVRNAGAAKTDVLRLAHAWVDTKAAAFLAPVIEKVQSDYANASALGAAQSARPFGLLERGAGLGDAVTVRDIETLFCALHGDAVKKALAAAIDAAQWHGDAIPQTQRDARIADLAAREADLRAELKTLLEQAAEAGIEA